MQEYDTPFPTPSLDTSVGSAKSTPAHLRPARKNGKKKHVFLAGRESRPPTTLVKDETTSVSSEDHLATHEYMLRMKREATCQLEESNRRLALASYPHDDVLPGRRSDFLRAEALRNKSLRAEVVSDRDFKVETERNKGLQLRVAALEEMITALQEATRRDWEHMFAQVTALLERTIPQRLNQDMPTNISQSSAAATDSVPSQISIDSSTTQANGEYQRVGIMSSLKIPATKTPVDGTTSKSAHALNGGPCLPGGMTPGSRDRSDGISASKGTGQSKKKRRHVNATPYTIKEKKCTLPRCSSGEDKTVAQGAVRLAKDSGPKSQPKVKNDDRSLKLQPSVQAGFMETRNPPSHLSSHEVTSQSPHARNKEQRGLSSENFNLPDLDTLLQTRSGDVHDSIAANVEASEGQQLPGETGKDKSAEDSQNSESGGPTSILISPHPGLSSSKPSLLPDHFRSSLTRKAARRYQGRQWNDVDGACSKPKVSKPQRVSKSNQKWSYGNKDPLRSQGTGGLLGHVPVSQSAAPIPSQSREILMPRKTKGQAKVDRFLKDCHCGDKIDDYFRKEENIRPNLTTWPGEKHQFVSQCRLVSHCNGHQQATRDRCRAMVAGEESSVICLSLTPVLRFC